MRLLPSHYMVIDSKLSPRAAAERVQTLVRPEYFWSPPTEPFEGSITIAGFQLRSLNYRNAFRPLIFGEITSTSDGCRVTVEMRLDHLVNAFMLGGITMVVVGIWRALVSSGIDPGRLDLESLSIPGFLLFMAGLWWIPFTIESRVAEGKIRKVLSV